MSAASIARWLDRLAGAVGAALLSTLVVWWARPEILFLVLLGVLSFRWAVAPVAVPEFRPRRVLAVATGLYAAVFSFVTVTRHLTFQTHALDLGYYVQLVWSLASGRGPRVSLPEMHAWGDHLSPIVYLFAPLFWLAPGAGVLLVGQSVALALGALAVFALARLRLGDEQWAAALAVLYLVNPSLHGINVRDFHAAALAIPLLLAAMFFAESGRPWLLAAAAALVLLCREDAAIAVVGLGLWLAARRRWLWGGLVVTGALAVLAVDVNWVIPHYRGAPYPHLGRYTRLGRSLGAIAEGALAHPIAALAGVAGGARVVYALAMLVPLGFLPLLGGWDLVGVLPGLAENLLGDDPILYHYRSQYQSFVLPFLVLAAIGGLARLLALRPARWARALMVCSIVASLVLAANTVNSLAVARWWPSPDQRAARALLRRIPAEASVSAQERYVPHLSLRSRVFVFPTEIERSDYVVVNRTSYPWRDLPGATMTRDGSAVTIGLADGRQFHFSVVGEAGPHTVMRRL